MKNEKNTFQKITALFLAVLFCVTSVNLTAFASSSDPYGDDFFWGGDDGATIINYDNGESKPTEIESSPSPNKPDYDTNEGIPPKLNKQNRKKKTSRAARSL